jgi:uncharacterized membrane protein YsdA (DUF1294 family)/cold shock CspA family protein
MRKKGIIVFWNDTKGYGFIEREKDKKRVFFHVSEFVGSVEKRRKGEIVIYTPSIDKTNRLSAINVLPEGEKLSSSRPSTKQNRRPVSKKTPNHKSLFDAITYWIVLVFFGVMLLSIFFGKTPLEIGLLYSVMSVLTFIVYAWDKSAAQNNQWRTSESSLHLLSLAGGWLGALMAQKILRHKSIKADFRLVFFVTVVINILTLAWLHTGDGAAILSKVLSLI